MNSKMRSLAFSILILSAMIFGGKVHASAAQIAAICESAAIQASRESGVPLDVLRAISLTETGRTSNGTFRPWPWTVNMEGVGKWFETVNEARRYVDKHFKRGAISFDVGCFQLNYKWHGQAFSSIEEMFDPVSNARYAARFLGELYQEFGDWSRAAAAYHSRTPKYANRYRKRFDRIRRDLTPLTQLTAIPQDFPDAPDPVPQAVEPERVNSFPLIVAAGQSSGASLVPLSFVDAPLIDVQRANPLIGQSR